MNVETECTIRSLLPTELRDIDGGLERALREEPEYGAGTLVGFALSTVRDRSIEAVRDAMDLDLFSTLARGWSAAIELRAICIETRKKPEDVKTVHLGKHGLIATLHPVVDVECVGLRTFSLPFTLEIEAAFKMVGLTIRNGFIIAIGEAECDVEVRLKFRDYALHPKARTRPLRLATAHPLPRPGWEILGPPRH